MDMEIVKNIIQVQATWLEIMNSIIYKNILQMVIVVFNEYNLSSLVKNC